MKMSFIAILIMLPTLSMAKGTKVTAERAATLVRQASVEKCLAVVENNRRGSAEFESIVELGTKTTPPPARPYTNSKGTISPVMSPLVRGKLL